MSDEHSSTDSLQISEEYLPPVANIADAPVKSNSKRRGRPPGLAVKLADAGEPTAHGKAAEDRAARDAGEKTKKEQKPKRPAKGLLYETIFRAITATGRAFARPSWRIAAVEVSNGIKTPIEIVEGEQCRRIPLEKISNLIMAYVRNIVIDHQFTDFQFTARECTECAEYWLAAVEPIPTPELVRFGSQPGLCWNRVPSEFADGPTPDWDELSTRVTNNNWPAFMALVGSLLIPESNSEQYGWIQGEGNDSKSKAIGAIARVFGVEGSLFMEGPPTGPHWNEPFPGKRFVYCPDYESNMPLNQGPMKQLVGGASDNQQTLINPKHKPMYPAKLICKLMFASNNLPNVDSGKASQRRLILLTLRSTDAYAHDYPERLFQQIGAFFWKCVNKYHELCPNHEPIPRSEVSIEQAEALGAHCDDPYQLWFDDFLFFKPGAHLAPGELAKRVGFRFKDKKGIDSCYAWLRKQTKPGPKGLEPKYPRKRYSAPPGEPRPWYYLNLGTKDYKSEKL